MSGGERRFGDLPVEAMDEAQRRVNDWLVEYLHPERAGKGVAIGGPMSALLHSPEMAEVVGRTVAVVFDRLTVPRRVTELVILLTAAHWGCGYAFHTHRRYAITSGLASEVVDALAAGTPLALEGDLRDVEVFTGELLRDGGVSDDSFRRVAARWGRRGAVEVISTVGFYTTLSFVLNVDRFPVPDSAAEGSTPGPDEG